MRATSLSQRLAGIFLVCCTGAVTASEYQVGQNVQVQWQGGWYAATILETRGNTYKIRYAGFGSNWDEYVTSDRIAPAKSDQRTSRSRSAATVAPDGVPAVNQDRLAAEGRYLCQAFEGGLLHNQGEFVLRAGGAYEDLMYKSQGTWRFDPASRRLHFTEGSLANGAQATLRKNQQGKTAVHFDWGQGNVRWCYKTER